jgi:hypothetical protein
MKCWWGARHRVVRVGFENIVGFLTHYGFVLSPFLKSSLDIHIPLAWH